MRHRLVAMIGVVSLIAVALAAHSAVAAAYNPIVPRDAGKTVMLDGKHMTMAQVVSIARYGAKVQLTGAARQRSLNAYLLLLEGARENIPIYYFNRGTGAGRQEVIFEGDPLSPENRELISRNQRAAFRFGTSFGLGPEVNDEEIVRAMMAVRANTMSYEAASPQLTQMLIDFLNNQITPVVYSRGSPGEGDLPQMYQVAAAMIGLGDVYYRGVRMSASQALAQAGLKRLEPFGADDGALASTNAYTMGQAALLAHDAKRMLDWADLAYAMDLIGMNSSVTPIAKPVQAARPFKFLNSAAARALDMISGSYLFELDEVSDSGVPLRIIQDPESLRASSQRAGAARQSWNELRRDLRVQINSSDHNPVVAVGWSPEDSPELDTPWFRQYYVRGGPNNADCKGAGCEHGYILSNSNWEAVNVDNQIEALTISVAQLATAIDQRTQRFSNTFFTVISPSDVLSPAELANAAPAANDYNLADLMAEIQTLANPVPAQGNAIVRNVEDLQAEGRIKVARARLAVDNTLYLLSENVLNSTYWMNVRYAQDPTRSFGVSPTAAWKAFRRVVPWQLPSEERPPVPSTNLAYAFLTGNPASLFYTPGANDSRAAKGRLRAQVRSAPARTRKAQRGMRSMRRFLVKQAKEPANR
jgi:histidine ammonia-lyase